MRTKSEISESSANGMESKIVKDNHLREEENQDTDFQTINNELQTEKDSCENTLPLIDPSMSIEKSEPMSTNVTKSFQSNDNCENEISKNVHEPGNDERNANSSSSKDIIKTNSETQKLATCDSIPSSNKNVSDNLSSCKEGEIFNVKDDKTIENEDFNCTKLVNKVIEKLTDDATIEEPVLDKVFGSSVVSKDLPVLKPEDIKIHNSNTDFGQSCKTLDNKVKSNSDFGNEGTKTVDNTNSDIQCKKGILKSVNQSSEGVANKSNINCNSQDKLKQIVVKGIRLIKYHRDSVENSDKSEVNNVQCSGNISESDKLSSSSIEDSCEESTTDKKCEILNGYTNSTSEENLKEKDTRSIKDHTMEIDSFVDGDSNLPDCHKNKVIDSETTPKFNIPTEIQYSEKSPALGEQVSKIAEDKSSVSKESISNQNPVSPKDKLTSKNISKETVTNNNDIHKQSIKIISDSDTSTSPSTADKLDATSEIKRSLNVSELVEQAAAEKSGDMDESMLNKESVENNSPLSEDISKEKKLSDSHDQIENSNDINVSKCHKVVSVGSDVKVDSNVSLSIQNSLKMCKTDEKSSNASNSHLDKHPITRDNGNLRSESESKEKDLETNNKLESFDEGLNANKSTKIVPSDPNGNHISINKSETNEKISDVHDKADTQNSLVNDDIDAFKNSIKDTEVEFKSNAELGEDEMVIGNSLCAATNNDKKTNDPSIDDSLEIESETNEKTAPDIEDSNNQDCEGSKDSQLEPKSIDNDSYEILCDTKTSEVSKSFMTKVHCMKLEDVIQPKRKRDDEDEVQFDKRLKTSSSSPIGSDCGEADNSLGIIIDGTYSIKTEEKFEEDEGPDFEDVDFEDVHENSESDAGDVDVDVCEMESPIKSTKRTISNTKKKPRGPKRAVKKHYYAPLPKFLQKFMKMSRPIVIVRDRYDETDTKVKVYCIVFHEMVFNWAISETMLSTYECSRTIRSRQGKEMRFMFSDRMDPLGNDFHPVRVGDKFPFSLKKDNKNSNCDISKLPYSLQCFADTCPSSVTERNITVNGKNSKIGAFEFSDDSLEWAFQETYLSRFQDSPILCNLLGLNPDSSKVWPSEAESFLEGDPIDYSFPFTSPQSKVHMEHLLFKDYSPDLPESVLHDTLEMPAIPYEYERRIRGDREALVRLLALASYYKYSLMLPSASQNEKLTVCYSSILFSLKPLIISQANSFAFSIRDTRRWLLKDIECDDESIIPSLINGPIFSKSRHIFSNVQKLVSSVARDPDNVLKPFEK